MLKTAFRSFFCSFQLILICMSLFNCSGKNKKIYQIGVLCGLDFFCTITDGFKEKMEELGYVEGDKIAYDIKISDVDTNKYQQILNDFVKNGVDLILVFPTEASIEAKKISDKTGRPVVFANAFTENNNFINTIREPGGNMTGIRWPDSDIVLQRLDIMLELVPDVVRIWVPFQKNNPIVDNQLKTLHRVCDIEGLQLIECAAFDGKELESVFNAKKESDSLPDAILMLCEPLCVIPEAFEIMARFASENNIPLGGAYLSVNGYESIFGLMPENIPQGRQAAFMADKILRGTKAGTIPVVSAENVFILNYKAVTAYGLKAGEGLLSRANIILR